MKTHAWRSPSKGDLWVNCSGGLEFIKANQSKIDALGRPESSEAASQGTLAHEHAEHVILSSFHPDESGRRIHAEKATDLRPQLKPDILRNSEIYAKWIQEYLLVAPHGGAWGVELSAPLWYEPESKGTADFWSIEDGETLTVIDYKSGRNPVEVVNNIQIAIYLIAIYDMVRPFNPKLRKFRAGILQPFTDPDPQFWEFDLGTLEHVRGMIGAAAREVEHPFLGFHTLTVTAKGCRYCPAKAICPAQAEITEKELGIVGAEPQALPMEKLFELFKRAPQIRTFLDEVEDFVRDQPDTTLAEHGFERKDGRRSFFWTADEAVVEESLRALGVEPFETKLKTPAGVKRELGTADIPAIETMIGTDFNRPRIVSLDVEPKRFKAKQKGKTT